MSGVVAPVDRPAMTQRLLAALSALENDDHAGWRANVDELIEWRSKPLVEGLTRLARELEQAMGTGNGQAGASSLPDACARLEHVVAVTENATMRSLDLVDECNALLRTLPTPADPEQAAAIGGIRARLSELTAAQGYQDLTGQIIVRVVALVRAVHAGLGEVTGEPDQPLKMPGHGHGPAVAGVDAPAASQDEANQLLSSLGL